MSVVKNMSIVENSFYDLTYPYCESASYLHALCFDFPWKKSDFEDLLSLGTTKGLINENALLVYSEILDSIEILTICTHPDKRRMGIGRKLLSLLIEKARHNNITHIFLEVRATNTPAISLYEGMGFCKIGTRKNYYRTKEGFCDAFCYELVLK